MEKTDTFRKSLRFRLIVASVLVEVVMLSLMIGNNIRQTGLHLTALTQARATELSETFSVSLGPPLAARDHASLRALVDRLAGLPDVVYLTVSDLSGRTLAAAGDVPASLPAPDPAVDSSRQDFHARAGIELYGQVYGHLHYALSLEALHRASREALIHGLAIAAVAIAMTIAALSWIAILLTRKLENLTRASVRLAAGDYGALVRIRGEDEVAALSTAFNAMAAAVREQFERLEDNAAILRRSNAELARMAEVTAHHLQEPLRRVASYSQLLKKRCAHRLDQEETEFLGYVVDGVLSMKRLLVDLLEYASVDVSPLPKGATADLAKCAAEAVLVLRSALDAAEARVEIGALPEIPGDAVQLRMVFQHLIGNAVEHRLVGQAVTITVSASPIASGIVLCVRDTGPGISPAYHDQIFELFERLDVTTQGTGVGLAIVRRIAERHGGHAWIESTPPHGTAVCLALRAKPAPGGGKPET
jgi:signal transduction histidine kinase